MRPNSLTFNWRGGILIPFYCVAGCGVALNNLLYTLFLLLKAGKNNDHAVGRGCLKSVDL